MAIVEMKPSLSKTVQLILTESAKLVPSVNNSILNFSLVHHTKIGLVQVSQKYYRFYYCIITIPICIVILDSLQIVSFWRICCKELQ